MSDQQSGVGGAFMHDTLIEQAPLPMFVCDAHGSNLYVNPAYERMSGLPADDLRRDGWQRLVDGDSLADYLERFRERTHDGAPFSLELRSRDRAGAPLAFEVRMTPLAASPASPASVQHWLGVIYNRTRERETEERARLLSRRYENMIARSPTVFIGADRSGLITLVDASEQNAEMRDWVGQNFFDLVGPDRSAVEGLRSVVERGEEATDRVAIGDRIYRIDWYPTVDAAGGVVGIDAIASDVTDRARFVERIQEAFDGTIGVITQLTDLTDPYTQGHEKTVADISEAIARRLGLSKSSIEGLRVAARLHDTGKIAVPSVLLSRPGPLSAAEFELIKTHVENAWQIFRGITFPWPEIDAIYEHHERLDGSGYPRGLQGDEISLPGRILAVADICDAMTSHRPYRPARSREELVRELEQGRARLYDAQVVDVAVDLIRRGEMPFRQTLGADRHGVVVPPVTVALPDAVPEDADGR